MSMILNDISKRCSQCGKEFGVPWPQLWAYKREKSWFCSYGCLRAYDKQRERKDVVIMAEVFGSRLAQLDAIVREIEEGRDPLVMLKERGYANPGQTYYNTKRWAQDHHPETAEKLPGNLKEWKKQLKAPKAGVPEKALQVETPEGEFVPAKVLTAAPLPEPVVNIDTRPRGRVTALDTPIGEFHYDRKNGYIDWDWDNTTMSLTLDEWKTFREWFGDVLKDLGVEI